MRGVGRTRPAGRAKERVTEEKGEHEGKRGESGYKGRLHEARTRNDENEGEEQAAEGESEEKGEAAEGEQQHSEEREKSEG